MSKEDIIETDKREAIKYILDVKSSQRCGTERCGKYEWGCNSCLTDQILALFPKMEKVELKVLTIFEMDDALRTISEKTQSARFHAISQATIASIGTVYKEVGK